MYARACVLELNHLHVSCHRDLRVVESTTCNMEDSCKHGSKCYFGILLVSYQFAFILFTYN